MQERLDVEDELVIGLINGNQANTPTASVFQLVDLAFYAEKEISHLFGENLLVENQVNPS